MNVSLSTEARKALEQTSHEERIALTSALSELNEATSWNQLIASRGSNVRKLSYSSRDAHDVAYRERRTPLYSYRVLDYRLILTVDAGPANNGGREVVFVIKIAKKAELHISRAGAESVDNRAVETFMASVQYGDWSGAAAADDGDFISLWDVLKERQLIDDDEFLIGVRVFNGENLINNELAHAYVHAFVIKAKNYDEARAYLSRRDPIGAREITIELTMPEFLKLFKRISLAICRRGLDIVGRDIVTD